MGTRHQTALPPRKGKNMPAVPGCDAGPAGRIGFVLRELRHLLARWRDRRRPAANHEARPGCSGAGGAPAGPSGVRERGGPCR